MWVFVSVRWCQANPIELKSGGVSTKPPPKGEGRNIVRDISVTGLARS